MATEPPPDEGPLEGGVADLPGRGDDGAPGVDPIVDAKGGKQNKNDTGILSEMRNRAKINSQEEKCRVLKEMYDEARCAGDTTRAEKIKATQKDQGCRHSSQSR